MSLSFLAEFNIWIQMASLPSLLTVTGWRMPLHPLLALKKHSWWRGYRLLLGIMFLVAIVKFKILTDIISWLIHYSSDLYSCSFLPWVHFSVIYLFIFWAQWYLFTLRFSVSPLFSLVLEVKIFFSISEVQHCFYYPVKLQVLGRLAFIFWVGFFGKNVSLPFL